MTVVTPQLDFQTMIRWDTVETISAYPDPPHARQIVPSQIRSDDRDRGKAMKFLAGDCLASIRKQRSSLTGWP